MFKRWKKIDVIIAILFVLANLSFILFEGSVFYLVLCALLLTVGLRIILIVKKKVFYKVRNRLIFSALFLVATPLLFVSIIFYAVFNIIMAQYGMVIFNQRMEERLEEIDKVAELYMSMHNSKLLTTNSFQAYAIAPPNTAVFNVKNGNTEVYFKYPKDFDVSDLPIHEFRGFFMIKNKLYYGLLKSGDTAAIITGFEVNNHFLQEFATVEDFQMSYKNPKSGVFEGSREVSKNAQTDGDGGTIFLLPLPYSYKYVDFDTLVSGKPVEAQGGFFFFLNYSNISRKVKELDPTTFKNTILTLLVILGPFLITSIVIGIRSVRVITRSLNLLTRGTQRIRNGDFSFRIKTKSGDQLQYLAESFNEMAAGIDRLLIDEKEKQRLEEELRIARSIQLKLLPPSQFETDEFEIAAINIPATEIAGDYFDYFYKEGEYLSILVADVSGKGTSAAFYMAELKGVINHLQKQSITPAHLIAESHDSLCQSFDRVTFITMNMAKFNIPEKKFLFARAGHTQAILYDAQKKQCIELYPAGMAIGLINFSRQKIKEMEINYHPGDILFLFSDGLSEIMNASEEMLGVDNIKHIIRENHHLTASEIKKKILDFSIEYSETEINMDDLTFILLKIK